MEDSRAALSKALESGDTDLIYLALLHLQKTRPTHEFFQLVATQPVARDLLVAFARHHDRTLLRQLYQARRAPLLARSGRQAPPPPVRATAAAHFESVSHPRHSG